MKSSTRSSWSTMRAMMKRQLLRAVYQGFGSKCIHKIEATVAIKKHATALPWQREPTSSSCFILIINTHQNLFPSWHQWLRLASTLAYSLHVSWAVERCEEECHGGSTFPIVCLLWLKT